jgi:hypothetical protein
MPLFPIENIDGVADTNTYRWLYRNGEELIDQKIITNINTLIVDTEVYTHSICLLRVPSLKVFENLDNLKTLKIGNLDICGMTIPKSVGKLTFENTNLDHINKVNVDWNNIWGLHVSYNLAFTYNCLVVPEGVTHFKMSWSRCSILRLPSTIEEVIIDEVSVFQITGSLPKILSLKNTRTKYRIPSTINICVIKQNMNKNEDVLKHIRDTNKITSYQVYTDLGSIRSRIRNPYEHRDEPIVAALFLASNIPRRMAEFVCETTFVPDGL